ncbi:MAG: 23S rRNA (uracil(1939)-C(5))-methyltransferase RlmD [Gammaproteobacteria bacterium]|nr:23S rRNA (uracil(1939)-C(5))-methyltransferase RlmD [Gammaproteobacteria bacterium]
MNSSDIPPSPSPDSDSELVTIRVDSLADDGVAVARINGKALFIEQALPGELVRARYTRRKRRFDRARVEEVLEPSPHRVEPRCPYVDECGGCALQHLESEHQLPARARILRDKLDRIGGVQPARMLPPVSGPQWSYRSRARFGVVAVEKGAKVVMGFRARGHHRIAGIAGCDILDPCLSGLIPALQKVLQTLSVRCKVVSVEAMVTDTDAAVVVQHLTPLGEADRARLREFAEKSKVVIYLRLGRQLLVPLGEEADLHYPLPEFDLTLHFSPGNFVQTNPVVNQKLVSQAMALLQPAQGERIFDLFCGIGNFTLPIARLGAEVVGVEDLPETLAQAEKNAGANGLGGRCSFLKTDLFQLERDEIAGWGRVDKLLLDPPRSGALEICQLMARLGPERVVYVSCDAATLARDTKELVSSQGYLLEAVGVLDMFPQTGHVESIALFLKA